MAIKNNNLKLNNKVLEDFAESVDNFSKTLVGVKEQFQKASEAINSLRRIPTGPIVETWSKEEEKEETATIERLYLLEDAEG